MITDEGINIHKYVFRKLSKIINILRNKEMIVEILHRILKDYMRNEEIIKIRNYNKMVG